MMKQIIYFAYGSNMSPRRLKGRAPSAESLGVATLADHALAFHKISDTDGSGKCDIVPSASTSDRVVGVLFRVDAIEKRRLDAHEGPGYAEKKVYVIDGGGGRVAAVTYYAMQTDPDLRPYTWYLRHLLEGATEAGLPDAYIRSLRRVEAFEDPDKNREARELAIYAV